MAEYAGPQRQSSHRPAPTRQAEPVRARSPEEVQRDRERARARAVSEADRAQAAFERATKAHADRDLESFETAEKKARGYLASLKHSLRSLQAGKSESESEEETRERTELGRRLEELQADVERLEPPVPIPEPIANEDVIVAAIPGRAVSNAHLAFAAAEARLIELLRQLDAKDRGIFLTRVRKQTSGDSLAERWARMTSERRARIIQAMRGSPPAPERERGVEKTDGKSVVDTLLEEVVGVPEASISADDVDGRDWLDINAGRLAGHLSYLLVSRTYELSHPRLRWGKTGQIGVDLAQAIATDDPLGQIAAVLPEVDLVGLANQIRPLSTTGPKGKDGLVQRVARAHDEAIGALELGPALGAAAAVGRQLTGHGGPVGPTTWDPDFGASIARLLDREIRESLARLGPRIVNAAGQEVNGHFDPSLVIASHPIDRPIARTLAAPGVVQVLPVGLDAELIEVETVRPVSVRWLDDPATWNWVEATPADATAEEVSNALFGNTDRAHRLGVSAPFFEVPEKLATEIAPQRRIAHEAREVIDGPSANGATALAESPVGERAALAQAERLIAEGAPDVDAQRAGAVCRVQLEILGERFTALGIDANLGGAQVRLDRRLASLDNLADEERRSAGVLFDGQRRVLLEVGSLLGRLGNSPLFAGLGQRLASAAACSDLVESARGILAEIAASAGGAAFDLAHLQLDQAKARFAGFEPALARTKTAIVVDGQTIEFPDIRDDFNALRERALDVEARQSAGTLEPTELERFLAEIQAFELKVRVCDQVTRLTQAMEGLSGLHGWNAGIVGVDDDLSDAHTELKVLRDAIASHFKRLVERQAAIIDGIRSGAKASVIESDEGVVADLRASLQTLGNERLQRALQHAYDTIDDAQARLALLEVAQMVGLALVTSGVGAFASGVARGFQLSEMAVAAIGATAEAGFSAAVIAGTSDKPFLESLGTEMVTNLAFFGAFRAFENVWSSTQAGRLAAGWKAAGGVDKVAAIATEVSAQGALAVGLTMAAAQVESLAANGKTLSSDEMADVIARATAMHIGSTIAHKVARPTLARIEAMGARGAGLLVKARRVSKLANKLATTGSLDEALELVTEARDLVLDEARVYQERGDGARKDGHLTGDHPAPFDALGELAKDTGVGFQELAIDAIVAGTSLTEVTGGFAGTAEEVRSVLVKAKGAGLEPRYEPMSDGGWGVSLEAGGRRVEFRELRGTYSESEVAEARKWAHELAGSYPDKPSKTEMDADLLAFQGRRKLVDDKFEQARTDPSVLPEGVTFEQVELAVKGDPETRERVPLNFSVEGGKLGNDVQRAKELFAEFRSELEAVLVSHGIDDAVIVQLGSGTTGWSSSPDEKKTGRAWRPTSDVDFAIFSDKALVHAQRSGASLNPKNFQNGEYTTIKNSTGFVNSPLGQDLNRLEKKWNRRIYGEDVEDGFDFKLNLKSENVFKSAVPVVDQRKGTEPQGDDR